VSEHNKHQRLDYSKFDTMPTNTLEEILRLDAQLPEGETPDPEAILYIMEVLAGRERESENNIPDVERAWHIFNESYRPRSEDDTSRDEEDNEIEQKNPSKNAEDIQTSPLKVKSRPGRRSRRFGVRMGFAAVLVVVMLAMGTVTASAFGYDLWTAFARWTGEVFGFHNSIEQQGNYVDKQLNVLRYSMEERGITQKVLPNYLPEGYEVVSTQSWAEEEFIKFDCLLSNGEASIVLVYSLHLNDDYTMGFEKNLEDPEEYEVNGIIHYIMGNVDTYLIAWANEDVECKILGISSMEETKKIIDSIYEG